MLMRRIGAFSSSSPFCASTPTCTFSQAGRSFEIGSLD
jgi:hypothetical protein